ncbi:MAG: hypothetical protein CK425_10665 [Parachlamydia sp.]|nr:MAG: hypothetical protein CK425_10665 [Parachlamydia sp.]
MSRINYFFFLFLISISLANAFDYDYDIGFGLRRDEFHSSFAAPDEKIKGLSELSWKDLYLYEVKAALKIVPFSHYNVRLKGDYGRIFHGKHLDANKGEAFDFSAALGYQSTWFNRCLIFNPMIGWSRHELHLNDDNAYQVLSSSMPEGDVIEGRHSHYRTKWKGPWVGIDCAAMLVPCWSVKATIEYHWVQFRGIRHQNLPRDFSQDFKNTAYGKGTIFTIGTQYIWNCLVVGLEYDFAYMQASHGFDRVYTILGQSRMHLKNACWHSMSLLGTVACLF